VVGNVAFMTARAHTHTLTHTDAGNTHTQGRAGVRSHSSAAFK